MTERWYIRKTEGSPYEIVDSVTSQVVYTTNDPMDACQVVRDMKDYPKHLTGGMVKKIENEGGSEY
jgi:hypothetical protein